MTALRVALLQLSPARDVEASCAQGLEVCREAAAQGADVALFPELWSHGYALPDPADPEACARFEATAVSPDGPFVAAFRALARETGLAIALTYLESTERGPRNSLSLIDCRGDLALTYAKVHTCDFDREAVLTPGDEFRVCDLETRAGSVRTGAMICYDREFPEAARVLMLNGAEIILTPNACELDDGRVGQLRARAFENMTGIALANYAAPFAGGRSVAFDGMNYEAPDGPYRDMTVLEAGSEEGIFIADFDLDRLRAYRARETWGNAYRKPRAYGPLLDEAVREPFVRPDARR